MEPARQLRVVDDAGQVHDECPGCQHREVTINGLQDEIRSMAVKLRQAREDRDAKARGDNLWPDAVGVFRYWQEAMGHPRALFSPERFWLIEPFLKSDDQDPPRTGPQACRAAIRGCASSDFHMKRGIYANRKGPVHDGLKLIFRSQDDFERFREMGEVEPSFAQLSLQAVAGEVASRVLERATLIERELADSQDPGAVAALLVEIDRLIRHWRETPMRPAETAADQELPAEERPAEQYIAAKLLEE